MKAASTDHPMREERKVVTALFADIVGSTTLGEQFDPEDVRDIVMEAVARTIRVIEGLGGTIKDLAGDGVLALFGAPVTHEDDQERAVRAGLGIVEEIGRYGHEVARDWGIAGFGVRVGIESGLAVLGPYGAGGRVEYGATGDALNTAARLQAAASPGQVMVGPATHRLVEPLFEWGDRQDLALKGKADLVPARVAVRVRPTPGRMRGIAGMRAPIVGREDEVRAIEDAARHLAAGRGGILVITGDAGLGKSRLVDELREGLMARQQGAVVLEGRSASFGQALPYLPFRDLLRHWIGATAVDPEDRVRGLLEGAVAALERDLDSAVPFLAGILGLDPDRDGVAMGDLSPEARQLRTFEAVVAVLRALADRSPTLVVLEDLHWSDPSSLQLIERLLPLSAEALLLVLTHRPDPEHPSSRLAEAAGVAAGGAAAVVSLLPLPASADRALLGALVGEETLPDEVARRLVGSSEGNPFFLEELVRSMVDAGALVRSNGGWRFDHAVPMDVPGTVEQVVLARLDRLGPEPHAVVDAAAVLGRQFARPLLEALAEDGGVDVALEELTRLGLVEPARTGDEVEFRFRHALIQETAYRNLLRKRRRELHRRAAEAIEAMFSGRLQGRLGLLAYHHHAAGDMEKALVWHVAAADSARRLYAIEEALDHYTGALEVAAALGRSEGDPSVTGLLLDRGRVLSEAGEPERARRDLEAALRGAAGAGDRHAEMQAESELGFALAGAEDYRTGPPHLERALELARELGDSEVEALALARLSLIATNRLRIDIALEHAESAMEVAAGLPGGVALGHAMDALKQVALQTGQFATLEELCARLAELHRERGDLWLLQFCLFEPSLAAISRGDWEIARARLHESLELNRRIGDRGNEALYHGTFCRLETYAGRYAEALEAGHRAAALAEEMGHAEWTSFALSHLGWALLDLHALEEAIEHLTRAVDVGERVAADLHAMRGYGQLALARWLHGLREDALDAAARAESVMDRITAPPGTVYYLALTTYCSVAEVRAAAGEADRARRFVEPISRAAETMGWADGIVESSLALGRCAEAMGNPELAREQYRRALARADGTFPRLELRAATALATLDDRTERQEEAAGHAGRARALIVDLAGTVPDHGLRARFMEHALSQLPASPSEEESWESRPRG